MHYRGKLSDSSEAVFHMCLSACGIASVPHASCLTLRPFARQCPLSYPPLWFAPFIDPWDGLMHALSALDILQSAHTLQLTPRDLVKSTSSNEFCKQLYETLTQWLQIGLVILGPLDRSTLWNTLESRYYRGTAHFVLVYAKDDVGQFRVHDPEGYPCSRVTIEQLTNALVRAHLPTGLVQVINFDILRSWKEVLTYSLHKGMQTYSSAAKSSEAGHQGIMALAEELENRTLKSSEKGSLYFALTCAMMSLHELSQLFADPIWKDLIGPVAYRSNMHAWEQNIQSYCKACATGMDWLRRGDQSGLVFSLKDMANKEKRVGALLETSVNLISQIQ